MSEQGVGKSKKEHVTPITLRLSVIIPLLNEREKLEVLSQNLSSLANFPDVEIIFVDGGSSDGSVDWLKARYKNVLQTCKGRARQMNAGANSARGETLLFLHADTVFPDVNFSHLLNKIVCSEKSWGRFNVRIAGSSLFFPMISFFINWRSRLSGIATGDQCIFVRNDVFEAMGGYPEQALMEDIELSSRLLKNGLRPLCLKDKVITSGRRWEKHGVFTTILLMWHLRLAYWFGASSEQLARRYYN